MREWSVEDVPSGPYFHGTRRKYLPGESLLTDVVNSMEGEEDDRQMCFATVSREQALRWAYQRGIRHGGDELHIYEVEMLAPQVDINMHRPGSDGPVTSVMSPCGTVVRLVEVVNKAQYPDAFLG